MDTDRKDTTRIEVDDIDDEVYYREELGCTAKMVGNECAEIHCAEGDMRVCQKPGVNSRAMAENNDSFNYYDC